MRSRWLRALGRRIDATSMRGAMLALILCTFMIKNVHKFYDTSSTAIQAIAIIEFQRMCTTGPGLASSGEWPLNTREQTMNEHPFSRRAALKLGGATLAGVLGLPAIGRAAAKEIVLGGPAGAAKYFNADVFPVIEKKLDVKILYEGTNSLTNLQKMQADKASPKMSVVIMDDPVMLPAAAEGLITPMSASAVPNLGKLIGGAVHRDGMWANYQKPWAGIAYSTKRMKTPPAGWSDLWDSKYAQKII